MVFGSFGSQHFMWELMDASPLVGYFSRDSLPEIGYPSTRPSCFMASKITESYFRRTILTLNFTLRVSNLRKSFWPWQQLPPSNFTGRQVKIVSRKRRSSPGKLPPKWLPVTTFFVTSNIIFRYQFPGYCFVYCHGHSLTTEQLTRIAFNRKSNIFSDLFTSVRERRISSPAGAL